MKRVICALISVCLLSAMAAAQTRIYQKGTVIRMKMTQCMAASGGGFLAALSGQAPVAPSGETCPEYTLVSDRVVYVVVAKSSNELIPLADDLDFRLQKNEILVHIDDTTKEIRLSVRAMTLRDEWQREELERQRTRTASRVSHSDPLR
jgi:hypothetical protein